MKNELGILCIDFGTSSIRAAITKHGSARPQVLELGEAFRSSIDRASIPSAIFVDSDKSNITFGEAALNKGQRGVDSMLFEMSPKGWMTNEAPSELEKEIIFGTGLTRKHLLAGLLAQAFSAIATAAGIPKLDLLKLETRIAHPVWPPKSELLLKQQLSWITKVARQISGTTDQPISPKKLYSQILENTINPGLLDIDIEEPVAAALELFDNNDNAREICVVIDVGAGTTDLGIFLSLTPDPISDKHKRKFIQAARPRSMYMAGDLIDQEVIKLISSRSSKLNKVSQQELQRRGRSIKETLFSRAKKVFEAGVEVSVIDLEQQTQIIKMQNELALNFESIILEASNFIKIFITASFHPADKINVVFAGGGSNISFLHKAIKKTAKLPNGRLIPIIVRSATSVDRALPASYERLAVVLGGTTPNEFWPITSMTHPLELQTEWDEVYNHPMSGDISFSL
jgi:hypothetical protein